MKKTLIALAVITMFSSAANAAVIYEKEGTKIDIDGRMHFELRNDSGKRSDLQDAGSRVRVRAFQEIGNGFSTYGAVEFRFSTKKDGSEQSIGSDLRAHRFFAGIKQKDIGELTFGKQLHLGDLVPKANYSYDLGANSFFGAHSKVAHFISVPFNGVRVSADYYFGNADSSKSSAISGASGETKADEGKGYGFGVFYDGKFNGLNVRAGSAYTEVTHSSTGKKEDEFKLKRGGLGIDVKYSIVTFGIDWAFAKAGNKGNQKAESSRIGFQKIGDSVSGLTLNKNDRFLVGVKVDATKQNAVYGEYYFGKGKKANGDVVKMTGWALGVDHRFTNNIAVYLEGGKGKVTDKNGKILNNGGKSNRLVGLGVRMLF
ncbi:porin [Avibacterium paragallinarum]|uniref:Porin n=2 Tax=Avibacterium paragallinarum TaxID=728 RepID=A0A0F5EVP9_AVIPA|nr:porin [Avibacterium paragallinarum]KAA6208199.1 porin [Avibacterium paragallinarum]KKB00596.1 hypothetical protein Z012_11200 [Avibacterium paragallinarum]POY46341.1 porin [Avibacterium paragallinarum]RZN69850.1 porin [Avibacterium paragallinarum]RZN73928.1 porin [Avibacterium paragallinarum]